MGVMDDLLRLLDGGPMLTVETMADRLRVHPALVSMMLERLTAEGYLRTSPPTCTVSNACEGCPLRASCALRPRRQMWTLTDKGRRHLKGV